MSAPPSLAGTALRLAAFLVLLIGLNMSLGTLLREWEMQIHPDSMRNLHLGLLAACVLYALILALPFVPGVEIGIALLTMLGPIAAPYVYAATVAGLALAFLAGRLIPMAVLARGIRALGLERGGALIDDLATVPADRRVAALAGRAQRRWLIRLLRHRHIALAVLLNLPGNALIGGGGGIAMVAGLSRLFPLPAFLLVVAVAVAPVPLAVWLFGAPVVRTGW
jgi:uncharacterized membrane protein YdjX (TVP38/TMEM64 family)